MNSSVNQWIDMGQDMAGIYAEEVLEEPPIETYNSETVTTAL